MLLGFSAATALSAGVRVALDVAALSLRVDCEPPRALSTEHDRGHHEVGGREPDTRLPVAHTCFFQIDLPRYSSKAVLKEKLLYALHNCKDMDLV